MTVRHRHANVLIAAAACLSVVGLLSSPSCAQPMLLGYWPLEETDVSQVAVDASGNGLNGTYEGNVTPGVTGAPGFGRGADFDGATGQVLIGPGDANGLGNLVNDFTVMAWINPDDFGSKNRVFGSAPTGGGWGWGTAGTDLQITTYGVRDFTQAGPAPLVEGEWRHAAVALDSSNVAHFYLDGQLIGSQAHGSPGIPIDNSFYIGFSCCAAEHFDGQLDEVAVFSGVLSEEQIRTGMTEGVLAIPEPTTLMLATAGMVGLLLSTARQRRPRAGQRPEAR